MTPKNIAHGDFVNTISQIGQGTLDAVVTPGRVVMGHWQDEGFNLIRDAGTPQLVALLAAIKLLGDELFLPAHQGIWRGKSGQRLEAFAANWQSESRETTAFGIGEMDTSITKCGMEDAVFFQEIGDDLLLVAVGPTGDHCDENLQMKFFTRILAILLIARKRYNKSWLSPNRTALENDQDGGWLTIAMDTALKERHPDRFQAINDEYQPPLDASDVQIAALG